MLESSYVLVLFVALVGAAIGRFERREASIAMFGTAGAHVVVAAIALIANLGQTLLADAFFVVAWVASALPSRQAAVESAPGSVGQRRLTSRRGI